MFQELINKLNAAGIKYTVTPNADTLSVKLKNGNEFLFSTNQTDGKTLCADAEDFDMDAPHIPGYITTDEKLNEAVEMLKEWV